MRVLTPRTLGVDLPTSHLRTALRRIVPPRAEVAARFIVPASILSVAAVAPLAAELPLFHLGFAAVVTTLAVLHQRSATREVKAASAEAGLDLADDAALMAELRITVLHRELATAVEERARLRRQVGRAKAGEEAAIATSRIAIRESRELRSILEVTRARVEDLLPLPVEPTADEALANDLNALRLKVAVREVGLRKWLEFEPSAQRLPTCVRVMDGTRAVATSDASLHARLKGASHYRAGAPSIQFPVPEYVIAAVESGDHGTLHFEGHVGGIWREIELVKPKPFTAEQDLRMTVVTDKRGRLYSVRAGEAASEQLAS